ncbi:MAG TPA: hypothetical protein VG410_13125 [Solirubrobacteraceae bacterium]|nr:hypothetical protein [Solirubrobacteraceae bacterium]
MTRADRLGELGELGELVIAAWLCRAPRKLAQAYADAHGLAT